MHILAVTTRQWNPGDDFVLNGIKNLYSSDVCWSVYNRNPDFNMTIGNQWTGQSLDCFDQIVVAGSPQWYGGSVEKLFLALRDNPKPVRFYGIGVGESGQLDLSELDLEILRMAERIVTRGDSCRDLLAGYGIEAESMVCPAFFAREKATLISDHRVGCVLTGRHGWRFNVDEDFEAKQIELFQQLGDEVIIHHLEELELAKRHFRKVWYSYDPRDYEQIYDRFDVIVSSRLHGSVYAMSAGKPSFLIDVASQRCQDAAPQFQPLEFLSVGEVQNRIQEIDMIQRSQEIIGFKEEMRVKYAAVV